MTTAPRRRITRLAALSLLTLGAGCCQPCYVPVQPGCSPAIVPAPAATTSSAAAPAAVRYGEVCEAPAAGSVPSKSTPVVNAPRPRVVVSEPSNRRLAGRSGWRRSDPEAIATRVEGAVDDTVDR
jgi:hypothetical protein